MSFIHRPTDETSVNHAASGLYSLAVSTASKTSPKLHLELNEGKPLFTVKVVISGIVSGSICTFLALYYGLKTGITPSLNILGGVLGYAFSKVLMKTGFFGTVFTPQENAVIQTLSVAVYSLAAPALGFAMGWLAMSKETYEVADLAAAGDSPDDVVDINYWRSLVWCFSLFSYGFFLAYPVRNYYILEKQLLFPSGTATAWIINALHSSKEQARNGLSILGKFMSLAFCINMITWTLDGLAAFPIFGLEAAKYNWVLDWDLGSFGIGCLLDWHTNGSMIFGTVLAWGIIKPWLGTHKDKAIGIEDGWFDTATDSRYLGLYAYGLFCGLAVMLTQGAWGIVELTITVIRANLKREPVQTEFDELELRKREIFRVQGFPWWGSVLGYLGMAAVTIIVHHFMLNTPWYQTLVAVCIVPLFAYSNIEGLGRTDWDVASSYGKLMMFPIGAWNRGKSIIPSLAVAQTTMSGCSSGATLMQDFKTGYLLGANPTVMFYAQIVGCVVGCVVCPALFVLIRHAWTVPNPDGFVTGVYGPVFRALAVVATGKGFDALPNYILWFALAFVIFTLICNTVQIFVDRYWPKYHAFVPQASGMSIGIIVGPCVPMEFMLGFLCTWWWGRHRPVAAEQSVNYVASGAITGSGLAVVAQCIVSFVGLKPPIELVFLPSDASLDVSVGQWVATGILLAFFFFIVWLGAWVWFMVPEFVENPHNDEQQLFDEKPVPRKYTSQILDAEDREQIIRVASSSTNGFEEESHLV